MRFNALTVGQALMSAFMVISKDATIWHRVGYSFAIVILSIGTIRMVGAVNRALYIHQHHAGWLTDELDILGFGSVWPYYIKISPKDSGAHVFVVACRTVNGLSCVFVLINSLSVSDHANRWLSFPAWLMVIVALLAYAWNELYIFQNIVPSRMSPIVAKNLAEARELARSTRNRENYTSAEKF